ncbi:HSP20-like chaperone [Guyanagaster necrorhizus]|uniref:HSP20-like chaperone n=1 Tax=Guyanagaster necrorhizus TaxID=856835 RepID=A0A9P7VQK3_9AGAR|nr:HSP20-like chaperone [Guyanagaster necrorhizus MCA 3950]KAG7444777.1 HSP20-like chaperone [Guyanagaster necrorhizus MCA 3950]
MSVYYYEPFYHFDRLLDAFGSRPIGQQLTTTDGPTTAVFRPKMDLHEDSAKNTVTASFELPGLKKEDVDIDVHDGRLTISGEVKVSSEQEEEGYAVRERKYGKFSRMLRLPQGVREEEIRASFENGLLTVTFPKAAAETVPKKITIS